MITIDIKEAVKCNGDFALFLSFPYNTDVVIEPLGPGTATLTVTGTLREWTSGSAGVEVTVTGDTQPTEEPEETEPVPEETEPVPDVQPSPGPGDGYGAGDGSGDPFGQGAGESSGETADTASGTAEELEEELAAQIPEEQPVITKVPELAPQKNWKVYSLGDMDADTEEEAGQGSPDSALRPAAAGVGFLLLGTGFILKLILFRKQM